MAKSRSSWGRLPDSIILHQLQRETFEYFIHEVNPTNGLVLDRSKRDSAASIAAVGLALSAYPVGVERSFLSRGEAIRRTLATLRFFRNSSQREGPQATGYKGFYYHFLSPRGGQRVAKCELSTIDTAILLAGVLVSAAYFHRNTSDEREIRETSDFLYRRVDWKWASDRGRAVRHGWKPESGFLKYRWRGYNEALLLYILGLGSPTYPLHPESYRSWCSLFQWRNFFGYEFLYAGPLFIHQLPQVWLDLRDIQDRYMRHRKSTYFENSRTATRVQQQYAIHNPHNFARYSQHCWGITASDGPGDKALRVGGVKRRFFGYLARGVPQGPDDGTISPWAAVTSLPFAPEIVLPTIRYLDGLRLRANKPYGFEASFNPTYPARGNPNGWVSRWHYGLNQGPVVLMIENFRSGLLWELMRKSPYIETGLRRAGFRGGWLR